MKRLVQSENTICNYYRLFFNSCMALTVAALVGCFVYFWYPFLYAKISSCTVAHATVVQKQIEGMTVKVISHNGTTIDGFLKSPVKKDVAVGDKVWVTYSSDFKFTGLRTPGTWTAFGVSVIMLSGFAFFWIGVWIALRRTSDKGIQKLLALLSKLDT